MAEPNIEDISSPENQKVTEGRVDAEFKRLQEVTEKQGLSTAIADASGTIMGVAHFLKSLGLKKIARQVFGGAKRYAGE